MAHISGDYNNGSQIGVNHGPVTNNFNGDNSSLEIRCMHALLSPGMKYDDQKNQNPEPVPKTCRWALEHAHYYRWKNAPTNELLWIAADAGCGKSVLSRHIIDEDLKPFREADSLVLYYFFKDTSDYQRSVTRALASMLHQLFTSIPKLISLALPKFKNEGVAFASSFNTLESIFIAVLEAPEMMKKKLFCLVDALDECFEKERSQLVMLFKKLIQIDKKPTKTSNRKLLITSRPYFDITTAFGSLLNAGLSIKLDGNGESQKIKEEIDLVIKHQIQDFASAGAITSKASKHLEDRLLKMEQRTYLWLKLIWELIPKHRLDDNEEVEDLINELPRDIFEAYEKLLAQCPRQDYARKALQIVLASARPLTVDEMNMALHVNEKTKSYKRLNLTETSDFKNSLPGKCGHVISIIGSRIYLIHQTVKEFLIGSNGSAWLHSIDLISSHHYLGTICFNLLLCREVDRKKLYLNNALLPKWRRVPETENFRDLDVSKIPPLLLYAATFWADHYILGKMRSPLLEKFVNRHLKVVDRFNLEVGTGFHAAALGGHVQVIQCLLDQGADVNGPGGRYGTALQGAARSGHQDIVQLLLDQGTDVNAPGRDGFGTALQGAARRGRQDIVQLLLDQGADVNAPGSDNSGTALQEAARKGHQDIVQLLLDQGADVNAPGRDGYGTALQGAARRGHQDIVQLLLGQGADMNTPGRDDFGTGLQGAFGLGFRDIAYILFDQGTDVNGPRGYYGTALQEAARRGHQDIVQLLLDQGADVNALGGPYATALQGAARGGHQDIVQLLLDQGADVNAPGDGEFDTALQEASREGHQGIVQLLLASGAKNDRRK